MKTVQSIGRIVLVLLVTFGSLTSEWSSANADEPWISHYPGSISWEMELAHLDNFCIQIMNNPDLIGYILIYSGEDSCREEAQARAMRMKKYMMKVRGIQWDRVMWRDGGRYRGEGLEIFLLGIPRDKLPTTDFQYEPPAVGKVIRPCKRKRSGYDEHLTSGCCGLAGELPVSLVAWASR
jgi:hypothetical protein